MAEERDDRIRKRAYELWEADGAVDGRHLEHWDQAAQEINDRDGALETALEGSFPASDPPAQVAPSKDGASAKSLMSDPGSPGGTSGTGGTIHDQDA